VFCASNFKIMPKLLFVDDEPGIRSTLPAILQMHGFETVALGTVQEALTAITADKFDILLSDLNIGEPGDGFTVVSAMRRVQPNCRTFIITGYPAFETALRAIHAQVDDYIVKPANIPHLVATLKNALGKEPKKLPGPDVRLSAFLRTHTDEIVTETVIASKSNPELSDLPVSETDRIDHLPLLLAGLADLLESNCPGEIPNEVRESAAARGVQRARDGYSIEALVEETRVFVSAINRVIGAYLLEVNLSHLIEDLRCMNDSLLVQLRETLSAFSAEERDLAA
jgi:ActR/RegA family two-component response regulator